MDTARFSSASVLYRSKASAETSGQAKFDHSFKNPSQSLAFRKAKPSLAARQSQARKSGALTLQATSPSFRSPKLKHLREASTSRKKKKKQKEVTADTWGRHSRATAGYCLRSWSEINLTGSKIKPCMQTSRGFTNREKHSAEIYLLALQRQRPKIHYFQTFQLAQDTDQGAQQVSLNANANVRSTTLHKALTPPPSICVF